MKKFLINAEVFYRGNLVKKDLVLEDGKILEILDSGKLYVNDEGKSDFVKKFGDENVFDCSGKTIIPGAIDVHVHFREPGASEKEDWEHASKAAAAGGVTTVCDMPNNTPPIFTDQELEKKRGLIAGRSLVNYGIYMGFNGSNVDEINKVENIPAVKFYACNSTGDLGVQTGVQDLFEKSNKLIVVHAEDQGLINQNFEAYKDKISKLIEEYKSLEKLENKNTKKLKLFLNQIHQFHSKIRSPESALKSVKDLCELAKKNNHRLHIAHLSTAAELEVVEKYNDLVTCEVCPHHLLFSEDDYSEFGSLIRMNPPIRKSEDVFALWKGLQDGKIKLIATDHAPHLLSEKLKSLESLDDFRKIPSGVPGVRMMLPILLNAFNDDALDFKKVVELVCENPAKVFGIKNKGKVEVGYDADLTIVDLDLEKKVSKGDLFSKCAWSPYENATYKGWPVMTFVNGEKVFELGNSDYKFSEEFVGKEAKFD